MKLRRLVRPSLSLLSIAFAAWLAGCHSPRGGWFPNSSGSTTYYSTETMQKTITMVDVRDGTVFFEMDIPPGKQLTIDFVPDRGDDPVYTPDLMRYQIFDQGTRIGRLRNSMSVPNAASRRIDVELHRLVEYADRQANEQLRTDQLAERPDWWTPAGGPAPRFSPAELYD